MEYFSFSIKTNNRQKFEKNSIQMVELYKIDRLIKKTLQKILLPFQTID